MSESDHAREILETIKEGLENLSLQQQTTEPRRQQAVAELIEEAEAALEKVERLQRRQRKQERRLADLMARFEEMDETTAYVPSRDVIEEGLYVSEQLRGLGDPGIANPALKEAQPNSAPGGLELLAAAVDTLAPEMEAD